MNLSLGPRSPEAEPRPILLVRRLIDFGSKTLEAQKLHDIRLLAGSLNEGSRTMIKGARKWEANVVCEGGCLVATLTKSIASGANTTKFRFVSDSLTPQSAEATLHATLDILDGETPVRTLSYTSGDLALPDRLEDFEVARNLKDIENMLQTSSQQV